MSEPKYEIEFSDEINCMTRDPLHDLDRLEDKIRSLENRIETLERRLIGA